MKQVRKNFKWDKEHDKAFKELGHVLCFVPTRAVLNSEHNAPSFVLDADVSDVAYHRHRLRQYQTQQNVGQKVETERELFAIYTKVRHIKPSGSETIRSGNRL